jgi:hypothetical protein
VTEEGYMRGGTKFDLGQKQAAIADLTTAADLFRKQNKMDLYKQTIEFIQKIKG